MMVLKDPMMLMRRSRIIWAGVEPQHQWDRVLAIVTTRIPMARKGKLMQFRWYHIPSRRQWLPDIHQIIQSYAKLK